MSKFNENLEFLQDIEEQMDSIRAHHCTYNCEYFDNGWLCKDSCPVLEILGELYAKANKLIKLV